jgi:ElaB/YqjD/DUF883 family membrane-anchored ribosome-binding protein
MPGWLNAFIVIAAVAIVIQSAMLVVMFMQLRVALEQITKLTTDLHGRLGPILLRVGRILDDSEERIHSIMSDAAEISRVARTQAQKVDRVMTDALERVRMQVQRADQILTGTLELIEDTGSQFKDKVWQPVQRASALIKGIKAGLDMFRRRRAPAERVVVTEDEELFI